MSILNVNRTQRDGNLAFDTTAKALACYWGGSPAGWRLANNAPSLTVAQRSGRSWTQGDIIYNTDVSELQIYIAGAWRVISIT